MYDFNKIIEDAIKLYSFEGYKISRRELPIIERRKVGKAIKEIAAHPRKVYLKIVEALQDLLLPIIDKTKFNPEISPADLDPHKEVIIYISNHKSHLDELTTVANMHLEGFSYPVVAAGENLFKHKLAEHILKGLGAFKFKRKFLNNKEYTARITAYLSACMMNNTPILFYPEGTRPRNGQLIEFDKGFIHIITNAFENMKPWNNFQHTDIKFVPIYIGYSHNPDEPYFTKNRKTRAQKTNVITQWRTKQKYVEQVYIGMNEPISYKEFLETKKLNKPDSKNLKLLCTNIQQNIKTIAPVFKEHLIYKAINDINEKEKTLFIEAIKEEAETLEEKLKEQGKTIIKTPDFDVTHLFENMKKRKIITINKDKIDIIKPKTIEYYTNSAETLT